MNRERAEFIYDSLWRDFDKVDLNPEDWDLSKFGLNCSHRTLGEIAERLGEVISETEAEYPVYIWARRQNDSVYLSMDIRTETQDHHFTDCT